MRHHGNVSYYKNGVHWRRAVRPAKNNRNQQRNTGRVKRYVLLIIDKLIHSGQSCPIVLFSPFSHDAGVQTDQPSAKEATGKRSGYASTGGSTYYYGDRDHSLCVVSEQQVAACPSAVDLLLASPNARGVEARKKESSRCCRKVGEGRGRRTQYWRGRLALTKMLCSVTDRLALVSA